MRTVQPSIVIGSYTWDQDRLPRDEFQIRTDALHRVMDENGYAAVLIYGDAAEHSALAYFSNFTPRLRWGMALLPRRGEPRLLVSMSPRDLPAMRLMTWIGDVQSGWNWNAAVDSWLAKLGDGPGEIGTVAFDLMRPPLFDSLRKSLGNRFSLHDADASVAACRTPRPRTRSLIRAASQVLRAAADQFVTSSRAGAGAEKAALEAERTARLLAAQDVRTLVSFDGGRTLSPYRGLFETQRAPLAGYIAVKHTGYWADLFVTEPETNNETGKRVRAALDAMLDLLRPGATSSDLNRTAIAALGTYELHPVLRESVGNRIGLSLDEGGHLARAGHHSLEQGDVYALHVGTHAGASGACFASALIELTTAGYDLIHRWPADSKA